MVFMKKFFELSFQGSNIRVFCGVVYLVAGSTGVQCDSRCFFNQSNSNKGLVFFVVIKISRLFRCPFISTDAVVFPSNRILSSFTSLYSVFSGFNGVILLKSDFGISVTGDPLSVMNLTGY